MNISLIPWWVKALVLAAIIGGIFGAGYKTATKVYQARADAALVQQLETEKKLVAETIARNQVVSEKLQTALGNVEVVDHYIIRRVTKEVEKPVYKECIVPSTGVDVINQAAVDFNKLRDPRP